VHRIETSRWQHTHDFCGEFASGEKNTRRVLVLTALMMVVEILGGLKLHSMALFASAGGSSAANSGPGALTSSV
jgi:Co/Zn/Cd efflux system component